MEKYPHSLFLYNPENLLSEGCINIPRKIRWEWKKARFGFQCLRTVVLWKENFPEVKQVKHVKLNFHHLALPCPSPSLSPIFESFPRTQVKHLWVPKCNTGMSQRNKRFLWNRKTFCCWKFQNKLNTITKNKSNKIQSSERMEQKTVDYYNDAAMNTCCVSDIVLRALHALTLGFSSAGWLCYPYFAEGAMGTQRD